MAVYVYVNPSLVHGYFYVLFLGSAYCCFTFGIKKMAGPYLPKDGEDMRQADYMLACWKFKHRDATGAVSLEDSRKRITFPRRFLENWWSILDAEAAQIPLSRSHPRGVAGITRPRFGSTGAGAGGGAKEDPGGILSGAAALVVGSETSRRGRPAAVSRTPTGCVPYHISAEVKGRKTVHIVVGDLGDGNRSDVKLDI